MVIIIATDGTLRTSLMIPALRCATFATALSCGLEEYPRAPIPEIEKKKSLNPMALHCQKKKIKKKKKSEKSDTYHTSSYILRIYVLYLD